MQAVGRCAVCRADGLLLRTNMAAAALRRGAARLSLLRTTAGVLLHNKRGSPAAHRAGRWTADAAVRTGLSAAGLCAAVPFTQVENLSHDSLIRRAVTLVTDSAGTYLSQSTLALIDALSDYAKAVHTLIAIQRRYLASLGKLTPAEEDSIWQVIVSQRADVSERLEVCKRFESTWTNALNLCEMAAEAAYTSGAEQASIVVRTHIHLAQTQVSDVQKLSKDAEKKLAESKVEEIQRMAEYTGSREEHELHEAYLRED